jgi:hypothetical protein
MAKKNFKGGLDSLIENSLGIKKSRKGEMKGNPVDLIKPEQTDDNDDEVLAKPRTPKPKSTEVAVAEPEVKAEPEKNETVEEPLEFENVIEPDDEPVEPAEPIEPVKPEEPAVPVEDNRKVMTVSLDATDDDSTKTAYLKEVIADLRHELFLWRNGTINVQTFNATLHTHGLKYNPENNEIEEFDTV